VAIPDETVSSTRNAPVARLVTREKFSSSSSDCRAATRVKSVRVGRTTTADVTCAIVNDKRDEQQLCVSDSVRLVRKRAVPAETRFDQQGRDRRVSSRCRVFKKSSPNSKVGAASSAAARRTLSVLDHMLSRQTRLRRLHGSHRSDR
jgi:hypothetical protein